MTIRQDTSIQIALDNIEHFNNKADIRSYLLNQWIIEAPETKYRYFVETLANGNRIYLERPGRLNKGCDFVIYIENTYQWQNGNDRPPDHDFILNDLTAKKQLLSQDDWNSFLNAVNYIYNCDTYQNASALIQNLPNLNGHSYELILKTIRWFLIEQDITYWSGQGRNMFYDTIRNI